MPQTTPPPQMLPVTARWCLEAPAPARATRPPCIDLEVASTPEQQRLGLMARPPLPPLRGMWFPFPKPQPLRFWMYQTPSPLDMLFLRGGAVIAIATDARPCLKLPCPDYGPDADSDGVVELAAGEAKRLGIRVGSRALIQPISVQATGAGR